jgi:hypothetical protein
MLGTVSSLGRIPAVRLRAGACALCLAVLLALASVSAPGALAAGFEGSGAGSKLTEGGSEATQTQTTATTPTTETSNSKGTILIAGVAAVLLLSGIAFVIVRDARRVAPATADDFAESRSGHDAAVALRKRRAKAKAARKQRKRTR